MLWNFGKIIKIVILICFTSGFLSAQNVSVNIKTDTNNVLIGDQIKVTLTINTDAKTNIVMPTIPDSAGKLVFVGFTKIDTLNQGLQLKQVIVLTCFDKGEYWLPPFTIMYEKKGISTLYPVSSDSILMKFRTVAVDTTKEFKDIKPTLEEPFTWDEYLPYIYTIGGILLLAVAAYFLWKRFKPRKTEELEYDPKIPPHVFAIEALKQLDNEKLWHKGFVKQYYIRLTEIIRTYMERRYKIMALEMITDDIIEELAKLKIDKTLLDKMKFSLETADLAKFAKFQPLPDENTRSMNTMIEFVNATAEEVTEATTVNKQETKTETDGGNA